MGAMTQELAGESGEAAVGKAGEAGGKAQTEAETPKGLKDYVRK